VTEVARALSAIYLDVIGERIDALGCSNLLSGWAELFIRDEELFAGLAQIVIDKAAQDAFFVKGDATIAVNILKSMEQLELTHEELLTTVLEFLVDNFDELKVSWAATLFKTIGTMSEGSQEMLLATMTQLC
jgi:hypothetical protein